MSKKPKKITAEEKIAIVLKAISGGEESLEQLSKDHKVPVDEIREWVIEYEKSNVRDENEVSLEASDDFTKSVEYGATFDNLNYKRLTFWSLFGTAAVLLFIFGIMVMHDYMRAGFAQDRSAESQFYNIQEIQQRDRARLESFGVVDPEEGIYRIPIDSAITLIAED
jgi:hypothetical protein